MHSPCINLGTRWKWVVSFLPWQLYPQGKKPWYPLDKRLGGSQSQSGPGSKERKSQPLLGSNPSHPAHSLVTILTELAYCIKKCHDKFIAIAMVLLLLLPPPSELTVFLYTHFIIFHCISHMPNSTRRWSNCNFIWFTLSKSENYWIQKQIVR